MMTNSNLLMATMATMRNNAHSNGHRVAVAGNSCMLLYSLYFLKKLQSFSSIDSITMNRTNVYDMRRIRKLYQLLYSICGYKEIGLSFGIVFGLIIRAICDLKLVHLITDVEKNVVHRRLPSFMKALLNYGCWAVPVGGVNALLSYFINELSLSLREKLSLRLIRRFTQNNAFFYLGDKEKDVFNNLDQTLSQDIDDFTNSLTSFISHVFKPSIDSLVYCHQLWLSHGPSAPVPIIVYLISSMSILGYLRTPAGNFIMNEQLLEGGYRRVLSKLVNHAEEIASLNGGKKEFEIIRTSLIKLMRFIGKYNQFKGVVGWYDTLIARHLLTLLGWYLVAIPYFNPAAGKSFEDIYQEFHNKRRIMLNLSNAIGQLILSGRDTVRLLGLGQNIVSLDAALTNFELSKGLQKNESLNNYNCQYITDDGNNFIDLVDLSVATPQGRLLLSSLNYRITQGRNIMIQGPNGTGKSTLLRCIAGLRPLHAGTIIAPTIRAANVYYLPQRPYLPNGSLRDQIIYPKSYKKIHKNDVNDDEMSMKEYFDGDDDFLMDLLKSLDLGHLAKTVDDLDKEINWNEVLSGGERQRLSIARLYYHCPKFALMDESTSEVSCDIEDRIYERCIQLGMTLITISHRDSLKKHHHTILHLTGTASHISNGFVIKHVEDNRINEYHNQYIPDDT